ncbi:hypothetical protein B1748_01105 [Paenibacillus sp. MY03]|nr:hypothetical protein B1748_01105 [Paenibacillus sp. MY03]
MELEGAQMKRIKMLLIAMAGIALLLTACGENGNVSPTQVSSGSESATATDNLLERIRQKGKIIVATSGTFKPNTFTDEDGQLAGYDIDWANMIADKIGVEAEFVTGDLAGLVPGLVAGRYDVILSGLIMTDERRGVIDFSERYKVDGGIAVVREDNTVVTDVRNLEGLRVGVIGGSGYMEDVQQIGGYKELKEYPGSPEAFIDLKAGRIDVYVVAKGGASDFLMNDKEKTLLKMVGEIYNEKYSGVGIPKGETELKQLIDELIAEKKQDGTYDQLALKWFGFQIPH